MNPQKQKNWKLLIDPFLIKGSTKLVRYEGQVPGDPTYPPVHVRDPRSQIQKLWSRLEVLDLPVPKFKIDSDYVGDPPAIEVTIFNVNDNIDKAFLGDLVKKFGVYEELQIFYHPKTNKHLGIARIVFETTKSARACVEKLNQTSVMGRPLQVFLDPFGNECKKQYDSLTAEKKPEVKPEVKKPEPKIKEESMETTTPIPPPAAPPPPALQREPSSNSLDTEEPYFNSNGHKVDTQFSFPPPNFSVPPPTSDYYGGWHQPFWNSGNNSWLAHVSSESHANDEEEKKEVEEEEDHLPLDLDTRIELLLKGKMSALNAPAFFQLNLDGNSNSGSSRSSSRAADNKEPEPCASPPLSPPPSPFISQEIYLEHHKASHPELEETKIGSEILNDEMSLSSLSSGDEKILNADGTKIDTDQAHALPYGSTFFPPPNYPSTDPYFAWRNAYGPAYPMPTTFAAANAQFPNFSYPPPNGYPPFVDVTQPAPSLSAPGTEHVEQQPATDKYTSTIEGVVDRIVAELKQILKKDFTRRMVEGTAFKAFENWWDEQTKRDTPAAPSISSDMNQSAEQLKSQSIKPDVVEPEKKVALALEGMNFGFGLGLRAAMPKLPSFKRKIRPPSPPPLDDDDSRRRLRDSDDEDRKNRRYRSRGSMRSLYSSSSSSSSSSEDEDAADERRRRNRRLRSFSFSSSSQSSSASSSSDTETISGAESISEDSLPSSPRSPRSPKSSQVDLELEEVSPERPPTPDVREEPEDQLPRLIEQAKEKEDSDSSAASVYQDHCYSLPPREEPAKERPPSPEPIKPKATKARTKLKNVEPKKSQASMLPRIRDSTTPEIELPKKTFPRRDVMGEMALFYDFLAKGIDAEDIALFHKSYENLLSQDTAQTEGYWLNETHWVDYDPVEPDPPPSKRKRREEPRPHKTGCARSEGYYKLDSKEKAKHKSHYARTVADDTRLAEANSSSARAVAVDTGNKMQTLSREARSNQRRLLTAFGLENDSDLLKFNQLKFRGAKLKFGKSSIHDWGLFALEPIAADEMVIEYVGQIVRPVLADLRETQYEAVGIGSSYLFRVDLECIIDATKCGNLARFINHSCNPNCYARVITIEGQKKIVIYSKQPIAVGEEITYDYKFPIEDDKIVCLCGSSQCRGYLN